MTFHAALSKRLPSFLRIRQREVKRRALSQRRFDPDAAPVALDNALANSQANARPRVAGSVEPFEYSENLPDILRLDSDAVIFYREEPLAGLPLRINVYLRGV